MNISIAGRQIDISDAFRTKVQEDLTDLLVEKHSFNPLEAIVTLHKERFQFLSEINVHLARGIHLRAKGHGTDGYTAFHDSVEVLTKQLRRHKKKLMDHHKHHDVHYEEFPQAILNGGFEATTEEEFVPAVIADMKAEIPTLAVADAAMRFDLSQEPAYVFRNAQNNQVNVLYRRLDGHIAWIDPSRLNGH